MRGDLTALEADSRDRAWVGQYLDGQSWAYLVSYHRISTAILNG